MNKENCTHSWKLTNKYEVSCWESEGYDSRTIWVYNCKKCDKKRELGH